MFYRTTAEAKKKKGGSVNAMFAFIGLEKLSVEGGWLGP